MSGIIFESPDVRFLSSRIRKFLLRAVATLLFRCGAALQSFRIFSRRQAAEFPAATQTAFELLERILRDRRAADRASMDALRPNHNSVNTKDPEYGISIIRERLAASARRLFPTQGGRRSPLPAKSNTQGAGQEVSLGQNHGLFLERKSADRARPAGAQWIGSQFLAAHHAQA